jgi:cytoskeleton protein RodZ
MPDDPTQDFGASLRQAREKAGVSIRQIAANTKISVIALEALERGDVSRLPGGIFSRAFVRAYAKEVGLDPEDAVRRFVARFPDESVGESPARYDANPERIVVDEEPAAGRVRRSIWWGVPIVLVVLYFGFGGQLAWWRGTPPPAAAVGGEAPAGSSETPVLTTPAVNPPPAATGSELQTAAPSAPPAPSTDVQPGAQAVAAAAARPTADSSGSAATQVLPEGSFRLSLTPRATCWVTVRVDHKIVYSGTMQAGERKDLTVSGLVSFTVGNAGAMAFTINDQPARSLGADGQVATAVMTAQNIKTFLELR